MQYDNQNTKDKLFLFTPGPVNVAENVRKAICKEDICHKLRAIFESCKEYTRIFSK